MNSQQYYSDLRAMRDALAARHQDGFLWSSVGPPLLQRSRWRFRPEAENNNAGKNSVSRMRLIAHYSTLIFGAGTRAAGSNKPKEKIAVAEAIATYCLPSTAYVIGDAVRPSPSAKCQRCSPVRESTPTSCP